MRQYAERRGSQQAQGPNKARHPKSTHNIKKKTIIT